MDGLLSPDLKVLNEPKYFSEFDLNEHSVLAALLIDSKDLCGDGSHFASLSTSDFAGDEFPPAELRQREASGQERESGTLVLFALEVERILQMRQPR